MKCVAAAKKHGEIQTLMFDGFTCDNSTLVPLLDDVSASYGILWKIKPHDNSINLEELKDEVDEENKDVTYEQVKCEFEKTHFIVKYLLRYCEDYQGEVRQYSKFDFKDVFENLHFIDYKFNGVAYVRKEISFVPKWCQDETRRTFDRMELIPPPLICPSDVYNTFSAFSYTKYAQDYTDDDDIEVFKDHIHLLAGEDHNDEIYDFIVKFLAHLIQTPGVLPEVAILIKSPQGLVKTCSLKISQDAS